MAAAARYSFDRREIGQFPFLDLRECAPKFTKPLRSTEVHAIALVDRAYHALAAGNRSANIKY